MQEAAPCPESSGRFASLRMPSRIGSATSAPPVRPPHSGMGRAAATTPVSVPPHQARHHRLRSRRVPAALLRSPRLLLADTSGPVADLELGPDVQHAGGRVVTEPGAPERPWIGRTSSGPHPTARREAVRGSWAATGRTGRARGAAAGGSRGPGRKSPFFQKSRSGDYGPKFTATTNGN